MDLPQPGSIVAVAAIVFGVIGLWAHRAVGSPKGRDTIIGWLESGRWWQRYHDKLREALDWLDRTIDPPPFAQKAETGRRWLGIKSFGVCITLSMIYSVVAFVIGWVAAGPSALGDIVLLGQIAWVPAWLPIGLEWLPRLLAGLSVACVGAFYYWYIWAILRWIPRLASWVTARLDRRERLRTFFFAVAFVVGVAVALAIVVAVTEAVPGTPGAAVGVTLGVAIAGILAAIIAVKRTRGGIAAAGFLAFGVGCGVLASAIPVGRANILVLLFVALPFLNSVLDWISLNVTRWFGRGIVAESRSARGLGWTVVLAVADLLAALGFLFAIAWFLAFGVEALGLFFGQSLELDDYVGDAVAQPWSRGLWASIMVLSTLLPTAIHFVLALAALWFAWFGNPVGRWCAAQLREGTAAHYLGPELYLVFGWTVPVLAVPLAMGWGLSHLFAFVEPLPDAILETALNGIATARAWFG